MNALADSVLERVFEPVSRCLTPAVARKLAGLHADPDLQAEIDRLAAKSNEGQLTNEEQTKYETYVRAIHFLTVLQSKARRILAKQS